MQKLDSRDFYLRLLEMMAVASCSRRNNVSHISSGVSDLSSGLPTLYSLSLFRGFLPSALHGVFLISVRSSERSGLLGGDPNFRRRRPL